MSQGKKPKASAILVSALAIVVIFAVVFAIVVPELRYRSALGAGDAIASMEGEVRTGVEESVSAINADAQSLEFVMESYDEAARRGLESFYEGAVDETHGLCLSLYAYALAYAETIASSDASPEDKAEMCRSFRKTLYDDAGFDMEYGIRDAAFDTVEGFLRYSLDGEHRDVRAEGFERLEERRSDVYDAISGTRDDVFWLYEEIRSCIAADDGRGAEKAMARFRAMTVCRQFDFLVSDMAD